MKTTLVVSMAVVLGLSTGVVAAAEKEAAPSYDQKFTWYDKDKNGAISQQEASIRTDFMEKWNKLDGNGDGSVDLAEFSAFEEANKSDGGGE